MEIKDMTKIDFGELLMHTAKNAKHITPELQRVIARFLDLQTAPKLKIRGGTYRGKKMG